MFDANRYAWNLLIENIGDSLFELSKPDIDKKFRPLVKKTGINKELSIYECNEECFDSAYRDILKAREAIKAASKAKKNTTGKGFQYPKQLKFKSKKQGGNSIEIRGRSIKYNPENRTITFFKKYFGGSSIKMKTDLKKLGILDFQYSCRLISIDDEYFLNIPYVRQVEPINSNRICAIDPGVRTFLTGYDPNGTIFEIGNNNEHLYKKKSKIEKLQRILSRTTKQVKRNKISKKIKNLYKKIKNCVNDMHHKSSKILSETYKEILLPSFQTQKMAKKDSIKGRKINTTTSYNMLTLSHYKFQQLLKHKMDIRKGKLIICTEEYTSKTCGSCGRLNHNLGSNKVFKCPYEDCKYLADRDINAARNIFIMNYKMVSSNLLEDILPEPPGRT
jgi:transposase